MRIISWNINGIKAHFDALQDLISRYEPDIVCLQKVKSTKGIEAYPIQGYDTFDIPTYRSRYYGVGTYYRYLPHPLMNCPNDLSEEGHFQALKLFHPTLELYNIYSPFSNKTNPHFLEAREKWDNILLQFSKCACTYSRLIMCGDFNIVDTTFDAWDGMNYKNAPCFLECEHVAFSRLIRVCGLVDVFRELHPQDRKFTYFNRIEDRSTNQGYRIDYFLVSRVMLPYVKDCNIIEDVTASNSYPILLDIDIDAFSQSKDIVIQRYE